MSFPPHFGSLLNIHFTRCRTSEPFLAAVPCRAPAAPVAHLSLYCCTPEPPAIIRICGWPRFRTKGQTRTPARDVEGTSRAAAGHSPTQGAEAPPDSSSATAMVQSPASADIPEEFQGAEPPSRRYHTRVGPRPPLPPSLVHPRPPRRAPPSKRA